MARDDLDLCLMWPMTCTNSFYVVSFPRQSMCHCQTCLKSITEQEHWTLTIIQSDSEGPSSWGLPSILLIVIVLGDHCHFFSNQVGRVEANTKLTNHGDISPCLQGFHESLGARLGNSTKVVDQVSFGHPNASIYNGESAIMLVWNQVNFQLFSRIQLAWVSQAFISYLIQSL